MRPLQRPLKRRRPTRLNTPCKGAWEFWSAAAAEETRAVRVGENFC